MIKRWGARRVILLIAGLALLLCCGGTLIWYAVDTGLRQAGALPTYTPSPTDAPRPTATIRPTRTSRPTATERPSSTPRPPTNTPLPPTATDELTITPLPTAIPPTAAPQIFKGKGQQASPKFELPAGLATFQMTHSGQRNFIVHLLDDQGELVDGLANAIGPYKGSIALGANAGTYIMDINADGGWNIVVQHPIPTGDGVAMPIQGKGNQAVLFLKLDKGLATFRLTHDGQRNFIVHLLDDQGQLVDGLVNVIGPFDGSKAMRIPSSGYYVLDVMADGAWSITAE